MEEISYSTIEKAIEDIFETIGVRTSINGEKILNFVANNEIREAAQLIAKNLLLPVKIEIVYEGVRTSTGETSKFTTQQVVKRAKAGSGTQGITAQVFMPGNLPLYGSTALIDFPIKVMVSKNCSKPPAAFIPVMAHELTHVLLNSLRMKFADNELYTDLTVMMAGFADLYKEGREIKTFEKNFNQTITHTTTYGYLDTFQFNHTYRIIKNKLKESENRKVIICKRIKEYIEFNKEYEKLLSTNQEKLVLLDKKPPEKIRRWHLNQIMDLHKFGYFEDRNEEISKNLAEFGGKTLPKYEELEKFSKKEVHDIEEKIELIDKRIKLIKNNIKVEKKNYSLLKKYSKGE